MKEVSDRAYLRMNASVDPLHLPSKVDNDQQQKADSNKNLSPSSNDEGGERSSVPANASVDPIHLPSLDTVDAKCSSPILPDGHEPSERKDEGGERSGVPANAPDDPRHLPSKVDDDQKQSADSDKNLSPRRKNEGHEPSERKDEGGERSGLSANAPAQTLPNEALPESETEVRTRLAAFF
jgi:hypothetical protein